MKRNEDRVEVFGDRIAISDGCKRFEVELGTQVILMRDTTDQYLIDQEIGKLYRHEMKAALDVMGVGLAGVKDLINGNQIEQAGELLDQVEEKRLELFAMLEERIDFIRLHSDAFQIRPSAVNVNMAVDKCLANFREAAAGKGVRLESNHCYRQPPVRILRILVSQGEYFRQPYLQSGFKQNHSHGKHQGLQRRYGDRLEHSS